MWEAVRARGPERAVLKALLPEKRVARKLRCRLNRSSRGLTNSLVRLSTWPKPNPNTNMNRRLCTTSIQRSSSRAEQVFVLGMDLQSLRSSRARGLADGVHFLLAKNTTHRRMGHLEIVLFASSDGRWLAMDPKIDGT